MIFKGMWLLGMVILSCAKQDSYRFKMDAAYVNILNWDVYRVRKKRVLEGIVYALISFVLPDHTATVWFCVSWILILRDELRCYRNLRRQRSQLHYEFPIWLRYVQCYLQTNTVYQALRLSYECAPPLLQEHLQHLLEVLESDPYQMQAYESFMEMYEHEEIRKMMIHLYRYNFTGNQDSQIQLQYQIEASAKWLETSREEALSQRLHQNQWMGALPLLSVTFLFIILMFQVMVGVMEGGWML